MALGEHLKATPYCPGMSNGEADESTEPRSALRKNAGNGEGGGGASYPSQRGSVKARALGAQGDHEPNEPGPGHGRVFRPFV